MHVVFMALSTYLRNSLGILDCRQVVLRSPLSRSLRSALPTRYCNEIVGLICSDLIQKCLYVTLTYDLVSFAS